MWYPFVFPGWWMGAPRDERNRYTARLRYILWIYNTCINQNKKREEKKNKKTRYMTRSADVPELDSWTSAAIKLTRATQRRLMCDSSTYLTSEQDEQLSRKRKVMNSWTLKPCYATVIISGACWRDSEKMQMQPSFWLLCESMNGEST
jgi:hypothetical protein